MRLSVGYSKIGCVGWSNHWIALPAIVESGQVIWGFHRSFVGHFRPAKSPHLVDFFLLSVC